MTKTRLLSKPLMHGALGATTAFADSMALPPQSQIACRQDKEPLIRGNFLNAWQARKKILSLLPPFRALHLTLALTQQQPISNDSEFAGAYPAAQPSYQRRSTQKIDLKRKREFLRLNVFKTGCIGISNLLRSL